MLVDDDLTDTFIAKRIIEITEFAARVDIRNDAQEALNFLNDNKSIRENLPDMIFLDMNMPLMDGFDFLDAFDKCSDLVKSKCQIIVLSCSDHKKNIQRILNNDYVTEFVAKPLNEASLNEIRPGVISLLLLPAKDQ